MRSQGSAWACLCMALFPILASAEAPALAHVASVQPPVWLERNDSRTALGPGALLYSGDRYVTGKGARLHIAMDDASTIKLGENTEFALPVLELKKYAGEEEGVFTGALKLLKGAFRFTTSAVGKLSKREINIYIGPTVTAGIRGTDIWGKSDPTQELLCLLEGKIEVSSPGHDAVLMDQPKTFYVVPHGKAPQPVVPTPEGKLESWMPQTELATDQVSLQSTGRWSVLLAQYTDEPRARTRAASLIERGYPVELIPRATRKLPLQALVIKGFATQEDALSYASKLQSEIRFVRNPVVVAPAG